MAIAVRFPDTLASFTKHFAGVFRNEPQKNHFSEYLLGLICSENKTVTGIRDFYAFSKDQSSLNKFLVKASWDEEQFNEERLTWLQQQKKTKYHERGVIAIDNVLVDHEGKLIEDAGFFWDHAEHRHKIAHDYLIANYVCPNDYHYPLYSFRFQKKEKEKSDKNDKNKESKSKLKRAKKEQEDTNEKPFENHHVLFRKLVSKVCSQAIPGDFAFDSYFCHAENLNYINSFQDRHGRPRAYVGDLKFNRNLLCGNGKKRKASEWAASILPEQKKELKEKNGKTQWYFTLCVEVPKTDHKIRIVFLWKDREDKKPSKILISNRTTWDVCRIVGVYRKRWTGTETFHRDGKQLLGMGDCQLRNGLGQTRHMYLVFAAYSFLMVQINKDCCVEKAKKPMLMTIGDGCRSITREVFRTMLDWTIRQVTKRGRSLAEVLQILRFA
jgi:hypothetical protein